MTRSYSVYENPESRSFNFETPGSGTTTFKYGLIIRPVQPGESGLGGSQGSDDQEYQAAFLALKNWIGGQLGKITEVSKTNTGSDNILGDLGSVRSVTFDPVPGSDFVYRSTVTYVTEFPPTTDTNSQSFAFSGSTSVGYRATPKTRTANIYKLNNSDFPGLPTILQQTNASGYYNFNGNYLLTHAVAEGETDSLIPLDVGYKPAPYHIPQMTIEVSEPWTSPNSVVLNDSTNLISSWPDWGFNTNLIGKRNDVYFLGADPGQIVYMGTSVAPRQFHTYTLTHTFVWDKFQHFHQSPYNVISGMELIHVVTDASCPLGRFSCNRDVVWLNDYPIAGNTTFGAATDTFNFTGTSDNRFVFANAATADMLSGAVSGEIGGNYPDVFERPGGALSAGPITQ